MLWFCSTRFIDNKLCINVIFFFALKVIKLVLIILIRTCNLCWKAEWTNSKQMSRCSSKLLMKKQCIFTKYFGLVEPKHKSRSIWNVGKGWLKAMRLWEQPISLDLIGIKQYMKESHQNSMRWSVQTFFPVHFIPFPKQSPQRQHKGKWNQTINKKKKITFFKNMQSECFYSWTFELWMYAKYWKRVDMFKYVKKDKMTKLSWAHNYFHWSLHSMHVYICVYIIWYSLFMMVYISSKLRIKHNCGNILWFP